MRYADQFCDWLREEGFTHCFFVAGGNIMHLLEAASHRFVCVPFIHEVSSVIAAEYFNEAQEGRAKAFALVTAGPGTTNALTGMAGAYLESRSLLVVGGQVKSEDLRDSTLRQRGIQELDGLALAAPLTKASMRIERPVARGRVMAVVRKADEGRKGPVFLEVCLDAQSAPPCTDEDLPRLLAGSVQVGDSDINELKALIMGADRPLFLIGAGITRETAHEAQDLLEQVGIPTATSWNAADRVDSRSSIYAGRPNTWGQRWANVVIQQADLVVALGARLGLQQTGFNWRHFAPEAQVVQVDLDPAELHKGHPHIHLGILADANSLLLRLLPELLEELSGRSNPAQWWSSWSKHVRAVRELLPVNEPSNVTADGYTNPYDFAEWLSTEAGEGDIIIPCSSGGAFTVMMQAFQQSGKQLLITNKGLASMGYGLAGAIGACIAQPTRRTILVEGDGGFAQNLQELGTVRSQGLNLKMFLLDNDGYASIRMTQRNYFGGRYVGCDTSTGLGLPDWGALALAYGIPSATLDLWSGNVDVIIRLMASPGPALIRVLTDPEQTYFPKINSRITESGSMESAPLHEMFPPLEPEHWAQLQHTNLGDTDEFH